MGITTIKSRSTAKTKGRRKPAPVTTVTVVSERIRPEGRLSPAEKRDVPTEAVPVVAKCGCMGMLIPAGVSLDLDHPYVSVRVATACGPGHPERVSAGVIARFHPKGVRAATAAEYPR